MPKLIVGCRALPEGHPNEKSLIQAPSGRVKLLASLSGDSLTFAKVKKIRKRENRKPWTPVAACGIGCPSSIVPTLAPGGPRFTAPKAGHRASGEDQKEASSPAPCAEIGFAQSCTLLG